MTKDTPNTFIPLRSARMWQTNSVLALAMHEEMERTADMCAESLAAVIVHEIYLHVNADKPIFDATGARLKGIKSDPEATFSADMGKTLRDYIKRADGKARMLMPWQLAKRTQFYEFSLRLRRARLGQSALVFG